LNIADSETKKTSIILFTMTVDTLLLRDYKTTMITSPRISFITGK
jgi:hypothetical protein